MSRDEELRASALLDEYVKGAVRGQPIAVQALLERCPRSQRDRLQLACGGVDYMVHHLYSEQEREEVVQRTFQQIQEMRRKRQALADAEARELTYDAVPSDRPGDYLAAILGMASEQLHQNPPALGGSTVNTWHRGGHSGDEWRIAEAKVQVVEQVIADQAEDLLMRALINSPPVDVYAVARHLCLFVKETPLRNVDGCLVVHGDVGGILISKHITNSQRKRFTCAHEIGHFIRHRHLRNYFTDEMSHWGSLLYTETEQEADTFAAMLLLPPTFLPAKFGQEKPTWEQADHLVETFDVSLTAAIRRMIRASHWRCALMVAKDGHLEYSVRSPELDAYDRRGARVHETTASAHLNYAEAGEEAMIELPAKAWLEGPLLDEEDVWVREDSRRLQNGYVYSLLTVIE